MTAPKPDPLAFGDLPDPDEDLDPAAEEPAAAPAPEPEPKPAPKRRLKNVWTANDGGPGPAGWRRHQGKVHGYVRNKGDKNPVNHGLWIDASIKDHPKWRNAESLRPRASPGGSEESQEPKRGFRERLGRTCVVM